MTPAERKSLLAAAIEPGAATPLGATPSARGVNFVLWSSVAERVELCLFDRATRALTASVTLPGRSGDLWHGFLPASCAAAGDLYAYRVHGPFDPARGLYCNPAKLLLDPCARALTGEVLAAPALYADGERAALDSEAAMPRCRIVEPGFDWGEDRPPATPWRDTLLYELHVKGFTRLHPGVPERLRGTYLGLAEPVVTDWLARLGVSAVELLPCQAFMTEGFLRQRGLANYWGYNPVAWSAPATQYAIDDPVAEFRAMVKALHAAGIEVILDVVFNHTAEGDERGPTLSLRGIDNAAYYRRIATAPGRYENWTGCGNTLAGDHPATTALILDCLRWWVEAMHVDGFRFDLAPVLGREPQAFNRHAALFAALRADPILGYVKLIAEPWDVGPDGYQLGQFPGGWSEWNDRYRDTVRAFWRGDRRVLGSLAERIAGSSDLFRYRGRKPSAGVNFITAHDGFTLADLVSYNERHNEANLEQNADGHAHNLSWNCGVEGPSDDAAIRTLRARQMRNLLVTLFVSQGVPMLQAGDELGRTQRGNNNAYCQDNELSWIDWSAAGSAAELTEFVRRLAEFRRRHASLRRETFLKGGRRGGRAHDVTWWHPAGRAMRVGDWNDDALATLGALLAAAEDSGDADLLFAFNAGDAVSEFVMPAAAAGTRWVAVLDTAREADLAAVTAGPVVPVAGRSAVVFESRTG